MKTSHLISLLGLTSAFLGAYVVALPENTRVAGIAKVRAVHGTCEFLNGSKWEVLKPMQKLVPGTTVRTGHSSSIDLTVMPPISTIRLSSDSTLNLQKMDLIVGQATEAPHTETILDLKNGMIVGSVKTLLPGSTYEILPSKAQIKSGDFDLSVPPQPGNYPVITR